MMNTAEGFSEDKVSWDPFIQFDAWYREHLLSEAVIPGILYLATASSDHRVSLRTVLLKEYNGSGFIFYTSYESKKGKQLGENSNAAMLFYWPEKNRQVRIEGRAEKIPEESSERYFSSRPRESQLAAWASSQSTEIPGREYLMEKYDFYRHMFEGKAVPRPAHWGGYRLIPEWFEFWEDRPNRLHDRITYTRKDNLWIISRLAP